MNKVIITGSPLPTTLFLIFLVLKLTGVIAWSWWWVTCPLWIGFAIGVAFMVGFFILFLIGLVTTLFLD